MEEEFLKSLDLSKIDADKQHRRRSCEKKIKHTSMKYAKMVAEDMDKKAKESGRLDRYEGYFCPHCFKFHVGHKKEKKSEENDAA